MKQFLLLAAVICFGVAILKFAGRRSRSGARRAQTSSGSREPWRTVNAGEAASLLDTEGIIVLDVRTQEEYDGGHLPGAVCLPVETMTDGDLSILLPDKQSPLLVYCRTGRRSLEAAQVLTELGYTDVTDMAGGILAWDGEVVTD